MRKLVKIQSISDIITNSSSEVFVAKINEDFKEFFKGCENLFDAVFYTIDDVKKFCCESDTWQLEIFNEVLDKNPLGDWKIMDMMEDLGKTREEVFDFFKKYYEPLVGYAIESHDDCQCNNKLEDYLKEYGGKNGENIAVYRY